MTGGSTPYNPASGLQGSKGYGYSIRARAQLFYSKFFCKIQAPKPQFITPSFSKALLNKITTGFGTGTISSIPQAY